MVRVADQVPDQVGADEARTAGNDNCFAFQIPGNNKLLKTRPLVGWTLPNQRVGGLAVYSGAGSTLSRRVTAKGISARTPFPWVTPQ